MTYYRVDRHLSYGSWEVRGIKKCNPQILFCKNRTAYNSYIILSFVFEILQSKNSDCFINVHETVKLADLE